MMEDPARSVSVLHRASNGALDILGKQESRDHDWAGDSHTKSSLLFNDYDISFLVSNFPSSSFLPALA